jgi:pimeloyl-ACP methyl ester carboxylesterase
MKKLMKYAFYIGTSFLTIAAINKLIFTLSTINENLYQTKSHHYQWKFGKVYYTIHGEGKPLLLLHNTLPGASSYEFKNLTAELSKNYKVYALDLLGYGQSDKPKITYTAYLYVQLILDFIKDIIGEPTTVISSGKSNAFLTMACYQNEALFNKLIFINPAPLQKLNQNPTTRDKAMKLLLELPIIGTSIYNIFLSKHLIKKRFQKIYLSSEKQIRNKYVLAFHEAAHLNGYGNIFTFSSEFCKYTNVALTDALDSINKSLYIIQGIHEQDDSSSVISNYQTVNPSIEASMVDNSRLFPHLERLNPLLEILNIYLHE